MSSLPTPPEPGALVAVAMSGGVDSSVSACLLKEQGWNVVGITMKLWDAGRSTSNNDKTCCTLDSSMDARKVCDQLGIAHYTLNMVDEFDQLVVEPFYQAFRNLQTPNPCVNCNSFVKWDALWKKDPRSRRRLFGYRTLCTYRTVCKSYSFAKGR